MYCKQGLLCHVQGRGPTFPHWIWCASTNAFCVEKPSASNQTISFNVLSQFPHFVSPAPCCLIVIFQPNKIMLFFFKSNCLLYMYVDSKSSTYLLILWCWITAILESECSTWKVGREGHTISLSVTNKITLIYYKEYRTILCYSIMTSLYYMVPSFQGELPGTTKILRLKVICGNNLAKKDIFGARLVLFTCDGGCLAP